MVSLRQDLRLIYERIDEHARVLDLGCGDGSLLAALYQHKHCRGYGVELDGNSVVAAMAKNVNVIRGDLEQGLKIFADNSFDMVVLSQTIQAMKNTETILRDMMRVGRDAIVTFPNFGYWHNRWQIALGRMPVSESMPYEWYNTPNIHWCTLKDFDALCADNQITIVERTVLTAGRQIRLFPNMLGSLAFYHLRRAR